MKHRAHAGKAKFQTGSIMGDFWGTLVMGQPLTGLSFDKFPRGQESRQQSKGLNRQG